MKIKIAQIKILPEKGKLIENHRRLMDVLAEVAPSRPDVVITSECYLDGYIVTEDSVSREQLAEYAISPQNSEMVDEISQWTADNQTWFIFGCMRKTEDGVYNSALIFNREGQLVDSYDKTHCQRHDKKFIAGNRLPVFDSDFGKFGVLICADRRWPETVRTLALKGANVIFNPTYGMHNEMNLCMMRTRSLESEIFIAFTHAEQALITSPFGEIVNNSTSPEEKFTVNEIDFTEVEKKRQKSRHLEDRRPELYELQ